MDLNVVNPEKKILLVEDEIYIQDLYKNILQAAGFEVITALDGVDALSKVLQQPKMILLDIMLPKLNGLQVLKQLKSQPSTKDIPIVLLTNLGQSEVIAQAFALGAQGYCLKVSLKPEQLIQCVETFLANPKYVMDINQIQFD